MDIVQHREIQAGIRRKFKLPEDSGVFECVLKILDDEELRYPAAEATEFVFGCEMNNFQSRNENPVLWDLFNGLWDGSDIELIKTIAKNHKWTNRASARGNALAFEVYGGEFLLITGEAIDKVFKFVVSR